ncbi:hypothetical protein LCGC14_1414490 [marine sediment metagenome]|uniref:PD-(D/E)XK endonuclease-like domain-containing protein n=1 Tax=marine sediment metagenome TaxID=412755 RepID=A0A0F9M8P4_9ZZZZ
MAVVRTNSEIKEYKNCHLRHYFGYIDLLAPKKPHEALRFGTAIHTGLEEYHTPNGSLPAAKLAFALSLKESIEQMQAWGVEIWNEDREQFVAEEQLGVQMLTRYHDFNKTKDQFIPVSLEESFQVKVRTPRGYKSPTTIFAGKIDGIVKLDGELWLLEHKTAASIDNKYITSLDLDDQVNTYLWAARELGYDIKGVIYNVLAKWAPKPPKLLKNGKLSTDKRQKTTHDLFFAAITKHNLLPVDYTDMLIHLEAQEDTTFYREKVYRNDAEFDRIGRELYAVSRDMAKPQMFRNPGACRLQGCSFRSICLEDTPEARLNFRIKEAKHEELIA